MELNDTNAESGEGVFIHVGRLGTPEAGVARVCHLQCLMDQRLLQWWQDGQRPSSALLVPPTFAQAIEQVIGFENLSGVDELRGAALKDFEVFPRARGNPVRASPLGKVQLMESVLNLDSELDGGGWVRNARSVQFAALVQGRLAAEPVSFLVHHSRTDC